MDNRSLRSDLLALGLLVLAIFLSLALVTYDPADPVGELVAPLDRVYRPDTLVYPLNETVQNACGTWGALASSVLFTGLGLGAYYLVLSLSVLDVLLLLRRPIDAPVVRLLGWCISLVGLTALAGILLPWLSPGPVIGSGGYLGALGAGLLEMHFAVAGGVILAASLTLGGLLLCTDYALVRVSYLVLRLTVASATRGRQTRAAAHHADDLEAEDEDDKLEDDEDEDEADELAVRVGGKTPQSGAAAVDGEAGQPDVVIKGRRKKSRAGKAADVTPVHSRRKKQRAEREQVMQSLDEAALVGETQDYQLPALDLLIEADDVCFDEQAKEVRRKARILEQTFANFGFNVKVVEIETGPVIAQYEVELEAGLRLSKITGLADDLAIALRVPSVRIVAPIPGKNTVGIEVPNESRQVVRLREVMEEAGGKANKMRIPLFLGKDVSGNSLVVDLSTLPHLLIAGRTGTGKSVCLNAIISSILMTRRPDEVRMLMIDPKMVELSGYGRLPHLMHPVVTDMRKAEAILAWAVEKMEERYSLLARSGVRHITSYNQLGKEELIERLQPETDEERDSIPEQLPFIVIIADEMADLMMTAGKEVEQHIIRLAQKSRAVGIHLILATQKPTVDVITGLIKSNLPARIAFQVASRTDSRVVLDEMGADKLLGNGDMLFLWPGTSTLLRGQGTYLSDDEINAVVDTVSTGEQNFVHELIHMKVKDPEGAPDPGELRKRDELYESAVDVVVREGRGSVSLLQRALGIGYGRAARLIDFMAEDGIVGEYNGSQAREVTLSIADWEQMQGNAPSGDASGPAPVPQPRTRPNVIRLDQPDEPTPADRGPAPRKSPAKRRRKRQPLVPADRAPRTRPNSPASAPSGLLTPQDLAVDNPGLDDDPFGPPWTTQAASHPSSAATAVDVHHDAFAEDEYAADEYADQTCTDDDAEDELGEDEEQEDEYEEDGEQEEEDDEYEYEHEYEEEDEQESDEDEDEDDDEEEEEEEDEGEDAGAKRSDGQRYYRIRRSR